MNTSSTRTTRKRLTLLGILAIVVVALDQLSKTWIRGNLRVGETSDVWRGVVHLSHVHNYGAAWSMLSGQRWLLILVTIGVVAVLLSIARGLVEKSALGAWSIGLILGGALGNLVDRILFGHVTDMIDLDTSVGFLRTFPIFNLADSALTMGVFLLILQTLKPEKPAPKTEIVTANDLAPRS